MIFYVVTEGTGSVVERFKPLYGILLLGKKGRKHFRVTREGKLLAELSEKDKDENIYKYESAARNENITGDTLIERIMLEIKLGQSVFKSTNWQPAKSSSLMPFSPTLQKR